MATSSFDDSDDSGMAVSFCVCTELLQHPAGQLGLFMIIVILFPFSPMFPGLFMVETATVSILLRSANRTTVVLDWLP